MSLHECHFLLHDWHFWARPDQLPPPGMWLSWLMLGGRGAGKTRAGAEWVRAQVRAGRMRNIALIGETYGQARDIMVEGPSGLRHIGPESSRPVYESVRRRLVWQNGSVATLFSASDPEALRGPQFDGAWCDELAKWKHAQAAWDMLQFGLRLGKNPRQVITTTPRPVPLVKTLLEDDRCVVSRVSTSANRANLAPAFLSGIVAQYEGTRLGRQELEAELLEDVPGALWQRENFEAWRSASAPAASRLVIGIDPPVSSGPRSDECGIVVVARGPDALFYVLDDLSIGNCTPAQWASRAVKACHTYQADRLVVEVNQGGDMAEAVIREVDPEVPVHKVHASRGKYLRAEPVAALYEQGKCRHVGTFAQLEDQMCTFVPGTAGKSPDRLDALVWAITDLMRAARIRPVIRYL